MRALLVCAALALMAGAAAGQNNSYGNDTGTGATAYKGSNDAAITLLVLVLIIAAVAVLLVIAMYPGR
jgi:hypothetical protein